MAAGKRRQGGKAAPQARRGPAAPPRPAAEQLELAMRALNESVYDWDIANGRFTPSQSMTRILGLPYKKLSLKAWQRAIHPDDYPRFRTATVEHLKGRSKRFECDYRYRDRKGAWRWARTHGVAIRDGKGRAVRMVGSTGDITEIKRTEQALKESEERYALATRAATEGIYEWNLETGSLFASERAKAFFSLKAVALTSAMWSRRVHPEDYPGYRNTIVDYFKGRRKNFEHEYRMRGTGGGYIWVLDRGVAVRNAAGKVVRMVGAVSDITQRKNHELELQRARDEAAEALERQTATADILKVIAGSPTDVQPVFDAIVKAGEKLFGGKSIGLWTVQDGQLRLSGWSKRQARDVGELVAIDRRTLIGRTVLEAATGQIHDIRRVGRGWSVSRRLARKYGWRASLCVPMLRDGLAIGVIAVLRNEPGVFPDKEVALLQTFADQAVIAIENARLFNETKEALDQQRATAEVMGAISGSISDTQPVFDRILESCERLFAGRMVGINVMGADGLLHLGAFRGEGRERFEKIFPLPADEGSGSGAAIVHGRVVHYPDVEDDTAVPPATREGCGALGIKSVIFAPMLSEEGSIGAIFVGRRYAVPFTDKEIELLKSFANQAAIGIKNVRLFNETREALERQTATAEILKVISESPTSVQPVLDAIVQSAIRLAHPWNAGICMREGDLIHLRAAASPRVPKVNLQGFADTFPMPVDLKGEPLQIAIAECRVVYHPDAQGANPSELGRRVARRGRYRSWIAVPLVREGEGIGAIALSHPEPGQKPTEKQLALLQTFASQAVIAIENVRLFNETKESLERQTATAEILKVIASSPSDVQPVFDAIVQSAARLFGRRAVLRISQENGLRIVASSERGLRMADAGGRGMVEVIPIDRQSMVGTAVVDRRGQQVIDTRAPDAPAFARAHHRMFDYRAAAAVPLIRDDKVLGAITVTSPEPGGLTDKQLALLATFADQAVIAIQNVRLFNETKEALERQTATAEILKVIASSPTDVQPVFDAIVQSALHLFGAHTAVATRVIGDLQYLAASISESGTSDETLKNLFPTGIGELNSGRAMRTQAPAIRTDIETDPDMSADARNSARARGYRSILAVPMLRDGAAIGSLSVTRREPGAFSPHQVELLKTFADQAVIAIENVRLFNETKQSLERQTATSEILQVISSSPTDLAPVFGAILDGATRLCDAHLGVLSLYDGENFRTVAQRGGNPEFAKWVFERGAFKPAGGMLQMIAERLPVQHADAKETPQYREGVANSVKFVDLGGVRSYLAVPLLKDDRVMGVIAIYRPEVRPFTEKQIELVRTFANQAVIAIENVRLFNETKESLERQTATAEILKVIASSPSDVQPVFDAILRSAVNLCGAEIAAVFPYDGRLVHLGATHNWTEEALRYFSGVYPSPPSGALMSGRTILSKSIVKLADAAADEHYDPNSAATGHWRRMLGVPMLREGQPLGALVVCWREPGETPQRQVDLLQTFADQAVIAIENVRLFNETKESLERQTATADILRVIASSPAEVQPVFDAIVETAKRLIGAFSATVTRVGDGMLHLVAHTATTPEGAEALSRYFPIPVEGTPMGRAIQLRRPEFIDDFEVDSADALDGRDLARSRGFRSVAFVPLLRGDVAIGSLNVTRREAGRMSDHQIELLKTFADQAVIAIENVRLFNETKEALAQQTASAEILAVIGNSMTDARPVFDAIVKSCHTLFGVGGVSLRLARDGNLVIEACIGDATPSVPIDRDSAVGSCVLDAQSVHLPDLEAAIDRFPRIRQLGLKHGYHSGIYVPLLRAGVAIGTIAVLRRQAGAFSEKEVALLKSFADQAVIAIENVRLFNETKESLERQTATAEILRVIASSPADVQPVFDAILESATRLCEGHFGILGLYDGENYKYVAHRGSNQKFAQWVVDHGQYKPRPGGGIARMTAERGPIHIADVRDAPAYREGNPVTVALADIGGVRTYLSVPMLKDGHVIGGITIYRPEIRPFSEKQIDLVSTFANQAVIAIENVRLFNETKESLERQTATAEILRVISSSPTDTQPVFEAILASCGRLFRGMNAGVTLVGDDGAVHLAAYQGPNRAELEKHFPVPLGPDSASGSVILQRRTIHYPDNDAPGVPDYARRGAKIAGFKASLFAPMMREGKGVGAVFVGRSEAVPFSDKEIALLTTFADQAVIAIENVRLFKELQQRIGQMTALSEVGQAISSTLDLETVLRTIVSRALQLTGLDAGVIYEYDEAAGQFQLRASENFDEEGVATLRGAAIRKGEGAVGTSVVTREPVQVPDTHAPDYPARLRELLDRFGYRALLAVPLLREEQIIGALMMIRKAPGAFAPEVVELLKTFGTQSAMAIQNARLFREIADKGKQLEVASHHKSQFLASMSHELRTPLNAILGFNEMILDQVYGEISADVKAPLENMQSSGKHLLRLINNVLDLAKIEAGRMELALSDYSVQDTVASVHSTLRPLAAEKGLEFLASVPADIPLAYGDGGRIAQCLMNLAGNSLKFTKAGKVEISAAEKDGLLTYRVADTGIGIPPDKIDSLFTEFKQTDATIASEYGGTGLGLSITKKFIEMHGGRIWIESELGRGSTFLFEIPLRVSQ